jgi:TonB family protein
MTRQEKFGKFVLLEEIESSGLGAEYRAAKLGPTGLEKIVSVLRLTPALSTNSDVAKSLMDQVKVAAQLQNPNIVKIFGIGRVEQSYYISYEHIEGKSLDGIFARCRQEGFPFSVDHGLLIASKICSALEYAHARRTDSGARYFHGLLGPKSVLVSYEGEVRVRGFGYWHSRARGSGAFSDEEALYLAPEQALGGPGDPRSDIFAVGAILFETLIGHPLFQGGRSHDIASRLAQARLQSPSGDDDALPRPLAEILGRSLNPDPAARYAEVQELRKAIDTLLFSGDFTPTTFNLAFFMHSLFREDIDRDSKRLKEEKDASYGEFAPPDDAAARAATLRAPAAATAVFSQGETLPGPARRREETLPGAEPAPTIALAAPTSAGMGQGPVIPVSGPTVAHAPAPLAPDPGLSAREAAAGFTFHRESGGSRRALVFGLIGLLLLGALAAAWFFLLGPGSRPSQPVEAAPVAAQTQMTPEAAAALARVKELEERLASMEAEKAAAELKAAEDARKKAEAQAAARGQAVDPAALERVQEEARRKERLEQERRQLEEKRRIEDEKKAEEARLAEEKRRADEEAARQAAAAAAAEAAAAPATTLPPPTTTLPALRPGALVNLSDPGVIAPVVERQPTLQYPPIALRQRVEGTVELNVLVDEKGSVADAQVITGSGGKAGLNEAAVENVKRRRYRPGMKDGVPIKVWIPVRVKFELPN